MGMPWGKKLKSIHPQQSLDFALLLNDLQTLVEVVEFLLIVV
jgi:hypothetical protein